MTRGTLHLIIKPAVYIAVWRHIAQANNHTVGIDGIENLYEETVFGTAVVYVEKPTVTEIHGVDNYLVEPVKVMRRRSETISLSFGIA